MECFTACVSWWKIFACCEQEKQRTEYDFLQAQVNPHFLNNTLLAVKSLIALGNVDRASRMMNQLVELLAYSFHPGNSVCHLG